MPRIPRYERTAEYPVIERSPDLALGAAVEFGKKQAEILRVIDEADYNAEVAKKALEIENSIRDPQDRFAQGLAGRIDYENFESDVENLEHNLRETYKDLKIRNRESLVLARITDKIITQRMGDLRAVARAKAREEMVDQAKGEWEKTKARYAEDYAAEQDPDRRSIIKNNFEIEARELANRGILWHKEAEIDISQFDTMVKATIRKNARDNARALIFADPEKALDMLADPNNFPDLDPGDRTALMEHAEVRIRTEGTRLEKLTKAIQNEHRAMVLDEWAAGTLDLERLKQYRERDPETGQWGLSDEFFATMMEKLKVGKDIDSDPETFNRLYLKEDLKWEDVDKESSKLSERDTRILLGRILQERREDVRESARLRKEAEMEARRLRKEAEVEAIRKEKEEERIRRERRNAYAAIAKQVVRKAMNEAGIKAEEGAKILKTVQGYIDDQTIAPEDLPEMAEKAVEPYRRGVIKWLKGLFGIGESPVTAPPPAGKRKSLDSIFGGK